MKSNKLFIIFMLYFKQQATNPQKTTYPKCFKLINLQETYNDNITHECNNEIRNMCSKNITVSYHKMEPFATHHTVNKETYRKSGMMQFILMAVLRKCCGNCITITLNQVNSQAELNKILTKEQSDIMLPVFMQSYLHDKKLLQHTYFIPLIPLESAMFIIRSSLSPKLFGKDVVMAIVNLWPLLGVSILLAFAAGVIMWLIDTWRNKEQFPRRFHTGAFEGFWWAFISMTTVGYGDLSPKSYFGRLFAVIWILCGITIISLLTAALTTAINEVALQQKPSLTRSTIGILEDHLFEKQILRRGNADVVYKRNVTELYESLKSKEIDGVLIDTYTAKSYVSFFKEREKYFSIESIAHDRNQPYLGIIIHDSKLHYLFQQYVESHREAINDFIYNDEPMLNTRDNSVKANLIFTTYSGLTLPTLLFCAAIFVLALVIGGIYELIQYHKRQNKTTFPFVISTKSIEKEETAFENDLKLLLKKWDSRLSHKIKRFSAIGMFSLSTTSTPTASVKIIPLEEHDQQTSEFDSNTIKLQLHKDIGIDNYVMFHDNDLSRSASNIYKTC